MSCWNIFYELYFMRWYYMEMGWIYFYWIFDNILKEKYIFFFLGFRLCLFLEDYKEDILCGLVWFVSGLDLLGYVGMLMLISFKFVKGKVRCFVKVE